LHFLAMSSLIYDKDLEGYVEPPAPPAPCRPDPQPLDLCLVGEVEGSTIEPVRACTNCKGVGYWLGNGFSYITEEGRHKSYPTLWKQCDCCDGAGWFHAPRPTDLIRQVKGRKPRTLRSKRPDDARPYFVWRLARFHGGKDVCLPMGAEVEITGDPYKEVLDELARLIAKAYFGSGNFGAARWQQAMHGSHSFDDLPAHLDGPVHDGCKPLEEMLEAA